jgi:hypothetical protein
MIMGRMAEPGLGLARSRPPSGGQDRSIRKNIVLPGYDPSGLHYGKNGHVLSGVERTGPAGGGPARLTRCEQAGAGWGERVADRTTEKDRGSGGDVSAEVSHGGSFSG